MITLHFNPQYDSGAWSGEPGKGACTIGESYIGPLGLLTDLEVRLGLTTLEKPKHELLASYSKASSEVADRNQKIFFADSLKLSPLATAGELMKWRDELVLSGWKADSSVPDTLTTGAKRILEGLAEVERALPEDFRTIADRWMSLLAALENATSLDGFSVKVHTSETHLRPVQQAVFRHLRRCGISVRETVGHQVPEIVLKHFHDSSDACLWTAAQDGDALIVCSDDQTMASAMSAFGRPHGNVSASDSPRPVAHIFTSAMMLLKDGGDIQAFRDYLSAPSHPLNAYDKDDRTLRTVLLRHVIRQRGFEGIDTIINDFSDGNPDCAAKIREWIPAPGESLTYDRVKLMCDRISTWAKRCAKVVEKKGEDSPYLTQWQELVSACEEMKFQCQGLGFDKRPVIPDNDFIQVLRSVTKPSTSVAGRAVVGSLPVVPFIENIAEDVQDVIWVDGSFKDSPIPLSFICVDDINELSMTLPYVWKPEDALELADDLFNAGLSRIGGTLTILYCDSFAGKKREKHHFILQHGKSVDYLDNLDYESIPDGKAEQCKVWTIETVPEEVSLVIDDLSIPDHETPTTLEDMFEQPLDWVLKSILHLYEESDSNDSLIKGLVAHSVINRIYKKATIGGAEVKADTFEKVFDQDFDILFKEAVNDTGAELNLPENKMDREQFKSDLRTVSIPKLLEIIRESHLTIIGSEVESKNVDISDLSYEPLKISGTIDLLLRNESGNYIIMDFKWAGRTGRDLRESQIKKGTDYQLALYRKLAETGTESIPAGAVDAQAFFMLKTGELLTAYPVFHDRNGQIATVSPSFRPPRKSYDETLEDIYQKYSDTVGALRSGKVSSGKLNSPYLRFKVLKGKID